MMNRTQSLSLLLILSLIVSTMAQNWQGSGNMTDSNMTEISTAISRFPISSTSTSAQIDEVAKSISDVLNGLWDPAWNVMITKTSLPYDTILYGYAFRNHWMWINGIPIPSSTRTLAYVIWKDYNCQHWATIASIRASASTFTPSQVQLINTKHSAHLKYTPMQDNWKVAYDFLTDCASDALMSSGAFSIIFSGFPGQQYSGYICLVNNNYAMRYIITNSPEYYGSYFMFQTR